MLTNTQRLRLAAGILLLTIIIVGVVFNSQVKRKARDVAFMADLRALSYAIEGYKEHFWRYPAGDHVNINGKVLLTENGFAPGKEIYFSKTLVGKGPASYVGTDASYQIFFSLTYTWPPAGITGTKCIISSGYHLACK